MILLGGASESRILYALRIYRAGKAPHILISGGNLPWGRAAVPEAELIADRLVELGAPRSALILETKSRTTRENAVNTAAIFKEHGWRNGLLVTSGDHTRRRSIRQSLPDAGALAWTTSAIKEMVGLCVYRLRGWA